MAGPTNVNFDDLRSPLQEFDGFIFDCDGTLADTMPLHHRAWKYALNRAGVTLDFSWQLFLSRAGMSLELTVVALNEQFGLHLDPLQVSMDQRAHFETSLHEITPIEPVVALARAAAAAHAVSVASGSEYRHVVHTLERIGARSYFEVIVTPRDVTHGKPAPDMFLLAAQRMGVRPERCLVLEDSELGIVAARAAGMHSALIRSTPPLPALDRVQE